MFELNCWSTTGYCSFKIGERCFFVCLLDLDKNGLYADDPTLLLTLTLNTRYYIFHMYIYILNTQFLNLFSWLYQSNYNTPVCHSYSCNYEKCERKFNIINDMKICKNVVTKESCYNIQRSKLD